MDSLRLKDGYHYASQVTRMVDSEVAKTQPKVLGSMLHLGGFLMWLPTRRFSIAKHHQTRRIAAGMRF
jgi:hypothetical protein